MREWRSEDCFMISGRGWVFTCKVEPPMSAGALRAMLGQKITLNGREVTVRGVETFMVPSDRLLHGVGFLTDDTFATPD